MMQVQNLLEFVTVDYVVCDQKVTQTVFFASIKESEKKRERKTQVKDMQRGKQEAKEDSLESLENFSSFSRFEKPPK
jgi:hypothetical protein